MYKTIEKHTNSSKKSIQIVGGDCNAELGPGYGVERVSVDPHTLKEENNRGDWMKQCLMIQTSRHSTRCTEKALENKLATDHLKGQRNTLITYSKDAEANDMIHMGSDHRCVTATFVINAQKKNGSRDANNSEQKKISKKISVHRSIIRIETKKHPRSKKDIKNSKKNLTKSCSRKIRSETKWLRKDLRDDGGKENIW